MSLLPYVVPSEKLVHRTLVEFGSKRLVQKQLHFVQYDRELALVEVALYNNGSKYYVPELGSSCKIRWKKPDRTFVYKDVLGCDETRHLIYFEIDEQMTYVKGEINAILELTINGCVAGSSPLNIVIDANPIQENDIESAIEMPLSQVAFTGDFYDLTNRPETIGTVSNVNTGFGLTGGPITTTGTLSVDTSEIAPISYVDGEITNVREIIEGLSTGVIVDSIDIYSSSVTEENFDSVKQYYRKIDGSEFEDFADFAEYIGCPSEFKDSIENTNNLFNSNSNYIEPISSPTKWISIGADYPRLVYGVTQLDKFKIGNIVYVIDTEVPVRLVGKLPDTTVSIVFYKLVDLTNYVDKTSNESIDGLKTFVKNTTFNNDVNVGGDLYSDGGIHIDSTQSVYSEFYFKTSSWTFNLYGGDDTVKYTWEWGSYYSRVNSDLGTENNKWNNLYLSGNISDGTNSASVEDLTKIHRYFHHN